MSGTESREDEYFPHYRHTRSDILRVSVYHLIQAMWEWMSFVTSSSVRPPLTFLKRFMAMPPDLLCLIFGGKSNYADEEPFPCLNSQLLFLHLSKRALADEWVYLIAVQPLLSVLDNVIVVVVIIAIIVDFPLFLSAAVLWGNLLGSPLLLGIVHLDKWGAKHSKHLTGNLHIRRSTASWYNTDCLA